MKQNNDTNALRNAFLDYFRARGHEVVPSSALVPANDPTLLFTNAGMVQFKDVFLGRESRPYRRAASSQRCVRAGGKHNDLENVGYTARHHTFFEMLGNFSFGDYFKRDAIRFSWEFLTAELGLPEDRLWVTVYEQDGEARSIWLDEMGVDPRRFSRIGEKDNFWQMGDTGPCGPCSEIFYDHGPEVPGGPPGTAEADGDRYVEIWNLVFMQYDRDAEGRLNPLPRPSVDTGMGLERLAAVMQGVHSNYEIDLFRHLIDAVVRMAGDGAGESPSARVIADHIRSCSFLIIDGVVPSNEGRGYVLRRIIRRAVRHGHKLGLAGPFFHRLVGPLAEVMGDAYPELVTDGDRVAEVLRLEEARFAETLEHGLRILEEDIANLAGTLIPGETVFKLYDTYGFPVDLTADIAREHDLTLDLEGFEREMAAQRKRARQASQFAGEYTKEVEVSVETEFSGYDRCSDDGLVATALFRGNETVTTLCAGEEGVVVLDRTPFYGESGGQVGDTGVLRGGSGVFGVRDTQKSGGAMLHVGEVTEGTLTVGDAVRAEVDEARRQAIVLNHSATHLLHAALREYLGPHVTQKGSRVAPDRLRFDFSHPQPVTASELVEIERSVNAQIRRNAAAEAREMAMDEAQRMGAMALFGEKYGERVRVLTIGDYSMELCGGTHVSRAGDIGLFKVVSESGVAAGVRRIEALTGEAAWRWVADEAQHLSEVAHLIKASPADVEDRVRQLLERMRGLEKELGGLKGKLAREAGADLADQAVTVGDTRVIAARLDDADPKTLRETLDRLKGKLGSAAVVLGTVKGGKVTLVAGVTKDRTDRIKAGELVNVVAEKVGGRGGGRPDMAQAGGSRPEGLDDALAQVVDWVRAQGG